MKKTAIYIHVLLMVFAMEATMHAQKKNKKEQEYQEMIEVIEGSSYAFEVQNIMPTGGRNIRSTSMYTMEVNGDQYKAQLPYFGRAYSAGYGSDGGVTFDGQAENLEITRNDKKMNLLISFDIDGDGDRYQVSLNVSRSGFGTLNIISTRRQPISYSGTVRAIQAE